MKKVWEFEERDESYIKAIINILANHCTYHDLTSTQAYEFAKLMDWAVSFPKRLAEAKEASPELTKEERIAEAKDLLEQEGFAVARPKEPVQLGPGGY